VIFVPFVAVFVFFSCVAHNAFYVTHTETSTDSDTGIGPVVIPVPAGREWRFNAQKARAAVQCARRSLPVSNRQYVPARQQRFHAGTNPK